MLSVLNMFLACLLIFPLFTGTTQAERSPLCEGAIVVKDSYVGETISFTLAGVEHDSQKKTYTLYWLMDCMLEDPAAVSPDYSIPPEAQPPHLFLWYCSAYAGEKELLCIARRNPVIMTDLAEFAEKEGTDGLLCYAVFQERDLPRKADEIDVHFTVMRDNQTNPGYCDYNIEWAVEAGWETIVENYLLRFSLSDAVEAGT